MSRWNSNGTGHGMADFSFGDGGPDAEGNGAEDFESAPAGGEEGTRGSPPPPPDSSPSPRVPVGAEPRARTRHGRRPRAMGWTEAANPFATSPDPAQVRMGLPVGRQPRLHQSGQLGQTQGEMPSALLRYAPVFFAGALAGAWVARWWGGTSITSTVARWLTGKKR